MASDIVDYSIELPFVSIIILNYNGKKYLKDLFNSLNEVKYPKEKFEIIFGDNASADDSVKYIREQFPAVKLIEFHENYGFCKGNNLCADQAKGEWLVFLNNDTIVTENWLTKLVNSAIRTKDVVTAGSKLLKPRPINGDRMIDYAGGKITYELSFYEGLYEKDSENYSAEKYTGYGCGAAVLVEKNFFLKAGGFDEYYFGGGEEVELGMRAWQYGFKALYVPSSVVYHLRYGSFKTAGSYPTYVWTKSILYFILKNFETKNIMFYLSENLFLSTIPKMVIFAVKRDFLSFKAVLNGSIDFLFELKKDGIMNRIYQKRQEIFKNKKISDTQLAKFGVMTTSKERLQYRMKTYIGWKNSNY